MNREVANRDRSGTPAGSQGRLDDRQRRGQGSAQEISMIKALVLGVHTAVCDRATQTFGAMSNSPKTPLADHWTWGRALRYADGPDEVHLQAIARMEIRRGKESLSSTLPYLTLPVRIH
jgi:acyl-CoA dehydrogenase